MKLLVTREIFGDISTLGELTIDGEHICYTCEDKVRDKKIKGQTAIPAGKYKVMLTWSNRFSKVLPLFVDVPGFEGVRIHSGNTAADTEGCILVGLTHTANSVYQSRDAMAILMPLLDAAFHNKENIEIEVCNGI